MSLPRIINISKPASVPATTIGGVNYPALHPLSEPPQKWWDMEENSADNYRSEPNPKPGAFKRSRKSGEIVMTNYRIGESSILNKVASLDFELSVTRMRRAADITSWQCLMNQEHNFKTRWTEQGDYRSWSAELGNEFLSEVATPEEIKDAIRSNQTAALAAAKSGYDVLTEYAERKQTVGFLYELLNSANDKLDEFINGNVDDRGKYYRKSTAKRLLLHGDDFAKQWAGRWLAFRYAIMPIIYSVQDVLEVVRERGHRYNTERRSTYWNYLSNEMTREGTQVISIPLGSSKVSSIVKSMFTNEGLERKVYQSLTVNPFNTAWELIPFSFVVDWFVNVGDYVMAITGVDLSSFQMSANVTKHDYEIVSYLSRKGSVTTGNVINALPPCSTVPVDKTYQLHYDELYELRTERVRTYERVVSPKMESHLLVDPSFNWQRAVDSLALTYLLTRKKLRSKLL